MPCCALLSSFPSPPFFMVRPSEDRRRPTVLALPLSLLVALFTRLIASTTTMSTFPQPFISSTSHWQATNRGPGSLWGLNADAPIPESADLVIIGGGLAGCALAYFLTRPGAEGEGKRIVLLEAKDIGSGASECRPERGAAETWRADLPFYLAGRNGGQYVVPRL